MQQKSTEVQCMCKNEILPDEVRLLKCVCQYQMIIIIIIQFICILESQVVECSMGSFLYTKILEVNLFAFACRLFHRDFSPLNGVYSPICPLKWREISMKQFVGKCKQINF